MMKNFFQRIFKKATGKSSSGKMDAQQPMEQTMPQLLYAIQQTEEEEYSCDDMYQLMDQYVEMVRRGEEPASMMQLVEHHLKMCPDCRQEVEALLRMLNTDIQK
jgi:hypothetical protein